MEVGGHGAEGSCVAPIGSDGTQKFDVDLREVDFTLARAKQLGYLSHQFGYARRQTNR